MGFFDEYVNEGGGENSYIKAEEKLAIAQSGIPFEVIEVLDEEDNVFEGKKQPRYVLVISLPNPATGEEESRKLAFPKASGVESRDSMLRQLHAWLEANPDAETPVKVKLAKVGRAYILQQA